MHIGEIGSHGYWEINKAGGGEIGVFAKSLHDNKCNNQNTFPTPSAFSPHKFGPENFQLTKLAWKNLTSPKTRVVCCWPCHHGGNVSVLRLPSEFIRSPALLHHVVISYQHAGSHARLRRSPFHWHWHFSAPNHALGEPCLF